MNWRAHTGVAVRAMVRGYLAAIGFVLFALLVIALSIDLTDSLDGVRDRAAATQTPLWRVLMPYLGYRAVDIVTRLLGMAALIGAGLAAALRHQRLEDVVLSAAGATPGLMLSALLIVGVITGAVQASFQNWLRPAVVERQIAAQLGRYGRWFGNTDLEYRWITDGSRAMRAQVTRGADPALRDIQYFEGIDTTALSRVIFAERAVPGARDGAWVLENATEWDSDAGIGMATTTRDRIGIDLPLNRARVRWFGIHGYYIPNPALKKIAGIEGLFAANDAATALAFRRMSFVLPGVFALLGASLALAGRRGRRWAPFRLLALATVGYVILVSVKVFWALGIHGRIPPYPAATIPLVVALTLSALLLLHQAGYLRRHD